MSLGTTAEEKFPTYFTVIAEDHSSLTHDITHMIVNEKIYINNLSVTKDKNANRAYIQLGLDVSSLSELKKLITLLQQVPGVICVERN